MMIAKAAAALIAALTLCALAGSPAAAPADPYLGKYRPVVVFAPDAANVYLARQKEVVASRGAAFRERDVVVVYVIGDSVSQQFGPAPGIDAAGLRAKYGIAGDEFHAILVGKDGGVKLKSPSPLSARRVTGFIDGTPMRGDERRDSMR